ncbi:CYFA0S35e00122g1_1 [Cyberlindnera fabianii]|uniref:CYFA0S35e00122g1_1 n=1 Tax=Cyberlindnera fabianii TaxID=36022 RepID=A0A061BCC4_CYBFA|nr:CYFA0S35e00122g1_1 [Cyberlindnera fabianii]
MNNVAIEDWIEATYASIADLSIEQVKHIIETPQIAAIIKRQDNPQLVFSIDEDNDRPSCSQLHSDESSSTRSIKIPSPTPNVPEDKHIRSGKVYLGESTLHNVPFNPKEPSIGTTTRPNTLMSTSYVKSLSKRVSSGSIIDELSGLSIGELKENAGFEISLDVLLEDELSSMTEDISVDEGPVSKSVNNDPINIPEKAHGYYLRSASSFSEDSTLLRPELTCNDDALVTYYSELRYIPDKTWLPRTFQHHKINKYSVRRDANHVYLRNRSCSEPPCCLSSGPQHHISKGVVQVPWEESDHLENFLEIDYLRYPKKEHTSMEVLCRFCRGMNWIPKKQYMTHLSLCHGILKSRGDKLPFLLPYPTSMFEVKQGVFRDLTIECPICNRWIRLSQRIKVPYQPVAKTQAGLYFNYFSHFIKRHREYGKGSTRET